MTNETPSGVTGTRVRQVRVKRGWTTSQLAQRCERAGAPHLTPAVINDIETGRPTAGVRRRNITVDELLALALALNIAPLHLVVPIEDSGEPYHVTPAVTESRWRVRKWVRGFAPLNPIPKVSDSRQYYSEVPDEEFAAGVHIEGVTMARVKDLWKDPARRGHGKRWLAVWAGPDGREHSKAFAKQAEAARYGPAQETDADRGTYVDSRARRTTVGEWCETWLARLPDPPSEHRAAGPGTREADSR